MKRFPALFLLLAMAAVPMSPLTSGAHAAEKPAASPTPTATPKAPAKARAKATPLPVRRAERVNPEPKKPGLFSRIGRLFTSGRTRRAEVVSTPTPTATPSKRSVVRPAPVEEDALPAADLGARPSANVTPPPPQAAPTPKSTPMPPSEPEPLPSAAPPVARSTPAPVPPAPALPKALLLEPTPDADNAYQRVRKEAVKDPAVAALAEKVNTTPPGEEQQNAAREYTRALFGKMREIDPSQTAWINRMEGATLRRIDAGKPFVAE